MIIDSGLVLICVIAEAFEVGVPVDDVILDAFSLTLIFFGVLPRLPQRCFIFCSWTHPFSEWTLVLLAALAVTSHDEPGRAGLTEGAYFSTIASYGGLNRKGF